MWGVLVFVTVKRHSIASNLFNSPDHLEHIGGGNLRNGFLAKPGEYVALQASKNSVGVSVGPCLLLFGMPLSRYNFKTILAGASICNLFGFLKRYFCRQYLDPEGLTSRYSPPPSNNRWVLLTGFTVLMRACVSGNWGHLLFV